MLKNKIAYLFTFILITTLISCKSQEQSTPVASSPSLFIKMEKTPCYGPCPSYILEIYNDGTTTFIGKSFIEYIGTFNSKISLSELEELENKIEDVGFFGLEDSYDSPATDIPSCIIQVSLNNKSKKIIDRRYGPEELKDLEKLIEEKVLKSNLIKSE